MPSRDGGVLRRDDAGLPPRAALHEFLGGAGLRIAVFFAVVFLLAGLAFGAVLWWATAGALERQTDAAIRLDAAALAERWRDAGRDGVVEAIGERLAGDSEKQTLYLLLDAAGLVLAGNLDPPEGGFEPGARWQSLALSREGTRTEARVLRIDLPEGAVLVVGRDVEEKLQLRELLAGGLAWSAAVAGLFALGGAWLLRRALEQRLRPAAETVAAIAEGDLAQRVPISWRDDEFDRLGQTMNAMLDRIAVLMEGVRGVSDAIAHDLRTPIARARAKLEDALAEADALAARTALTDPAMRARSDGPADDQARPDAEAGRACVAAPDAGLLPRAAETLRGALERGIADLDGIARVFQAVLRIAEAEAGARRAAFAPLDLAPLLADAAELYEASAEAREQVLETEFSPSGLSLAGDRDLLLQAVANLLDNAVKFAPPGGAIRLSARVEARRGLVRVEVSDDGPGLSRGERARAGERFFRADGARHTPGSGLGLSLVRAVAALHGGDLALADARPGTDSPGLRATLTLPLAPRAAAATPTEAAPRR